MRKRMPLAPVAFASLLGAIASSAAAESLQDFPQIERGRYLAVLSDCASCHTVPGSNQPFAGGRPIETPFGNIVAEYHARSRDRHRQLERRSVRRRGPQGHPARRLAALSGDAV
jgi:mono/diheme cytochrome c family protein